ncbi:MAG TPA: VOC family protein [Candidatus Binataceae bacterium]|nr:VOC family protein [Candidatus Binataceae bacterium]
MRAVSHIAVGVRDMDKSLHFYRDLLGLRVTTDAMEKVGGLKPLFANDQRGKRRAVYLRFEDGPHASFLVLSQSPGGPSGEPIKLDQIGVHHFAFWVDDLRERIEHLRAAGVPILAGPFEADSAAYGEPPGKKVLTCLFSDPDGIILQYDQRVD